MTAKTMIKTAINAALAPVGLKVVRDGHDWNDQRQYLPVQETLAQAQKAGLSVGDYIDVTYNVAGATEATIEQMARAGVFDKPLDTVVEIGPGSGRYLDRVVKQFAPRRYEVYEIAQAWADYLSETYDIVSHPTDGGTLHGTADASADLVHAHKVFCSVSFLVSVRYWPEMIRVTKPGGHVVFDVMTETCLDPETADAWASTSMEGTGTYPSVMPKTFIVDCFKARGMTLVASFLVPMKPGYTETLVFRKPA